MNLFGKKPEPDKAVIIAELKVVLAMIERLNIPVVADDYDAGYDTAIDEAIEIINDRISHYK